MATIAASLEDKMTIKMTTMIVKLKALVVTPAPSKQVEEVCVTCGSNHNFNHCPLTRGPGVVMDLCFGRSWMFCQVDVGVKDGCGVFMSGSSNVNPLFEENNKDVEIKSSSSSTLTSPEASELEDYLEKDSIPPGIDLTIPSTLEVSSSNPTSPTLTGEKVCSWKTPMFFSLVRFVWKMMTQIAIRKKIICILATYLHKKPKPLSQEVEEIKENEKEVSSDVPINTIVMPIQITFDNPIDFNDHFSKPKDLKKDLTISFDSTTTSILPHPSLDSDSPFTAELSASVTLNSLGNEDKVFKPGILVYHAIHDKNLVTLEENLKENISSGTLLVFKEPSIFLPPLEPPDECLKNVVLNFYQSKKTFPLNVEDVNSFAFIIWTFLPFFTYTKASPVIFSFRSENFVFDPGILTIQWQFQ
ncbi:hypothetical protein Tco_1164475 [Tanacetum coccineum]